MKKSENIRQSILNLTKDYYLQKQIEDKKERKEDDRINYAGRVYNEHELINGVDSVLDFWLTEGKYCKKFEEKFSEKLGVKYSLFVSSGSMANLISFMALTSHKLGEKRIKKGDHIITTSLCFPTTVAPIINYGAIPIFVDVEKDTFNIDVEKLEKAIIDKTKAIFLAHTLGNPFNVKKVKEICNKYNIFLLSDECDALGSKYNGNHLSQLSNISTHSYFPAHTITTGQGGMICTNNSELYKIIKSFRDWGRDYKCDTCVNFCKKRYENNSNNLEDYDCRYTYSHLGVNCQATEMQASIGVAQLDKLPEFVNKRKENFQIYYDNLKDLSDYFILPRWEKESDVSWFGFWITLQENLSFKRIDLIKYLDEHNIDTRMIFSGDITQQVCFSGLKKNIDYKIKGDLKNTRYIANNSFFLGTYPGLNKEKIDYICNIIRKFIDTNK